MSGLFAAVRRVRTAVVTVNRDASDEAVTEVIARECPREPTTELQSPTAVGAHFFRPFDLQHLYEHFTEPATCKQNGFIQNRPVARTNFAVLVIFLANPMVFSPLFLAPVSVQVTGLRALSSHRLASLTSLWDAHQCATVLISHHPKEGNPHMLDLVSPWLTRTEAADYARVSVQTIDRWVRDKKLTRHRIDGLRSVRFHRDDVDKLMIPEARIVGALA